MDAQTLNVILIVLTVIVAAYALYQRHKAGEAIEAGGVVTELKAAQPLAQELMTVATIAVQAAEQLKNTGKLPDNNAAFEYAVSFIKKWIPAAEGIDNEDIKAAIESAVLVASALTEQIKNLKPVSSEVNVWQDQKQKT